MFRSIKNRRRTRHASTFEGIESLEQRLSLSTIHWTGCGDGVTLNSKYNWQCNQLPGSYDTAIVDVAGTPQIKLSAGSFSVKTFIFKESLTVTGGTLNVGSGGTALSGSMAMQGGQFGGAGQLSVTGTLSWTGGKIIGTGKVDVAAGAQFDINGSGSLELGRDIANRGKIVWRGGDIDGSDANGNTILNDTGGVFRALGSARFRSITAPGLVDNRGTFVRDEAGHTRILTSFSNSGTMNVAGGTLELWGGGTNSGARNIAQGATLHYFGDFTHGPGSTLAGGGITIWQSGVHTLTGAWTMDSYLYVTNATITGASDWTIDGVLGWSHGRIEGTGGTLIGTTGKLEIRTDGQHDLARNILNQGTLIWNKGELKFDGATVTNPAGSVFYVCADATAVNGGGVNRIVNQGELRKQLPTDLGFGDITLDNSGLLNVRNGSLTLNQGSVAQLSAGTLSGGSWLVIGDAQLSFAGAGISTVGVGTSITRIGRHAGLTALNALSRNEGTIRIYGGGTLDIAPSSGSFVNAGEFFLNNSTALVIQGSFVQTASGSLRVGIGAHNMFSTGRAISASTVALEGSIGVTLELGYVPRVGDRFFILEGAPVSAGTAVVIPDSGPTPELVYLPTGVLLVYV